MKPIITITNDEKNRIIFKNAKKEKINKTKIIIKVFSKLKLYSNTLLLFVSLLVE